jgi:hypothetical protein
MSASEWDGEKVCSFLREKEVDDEIVALFQEAQVDGNQFRSLNDESLKALGIKRAMDRTCIKVLLLELHANVIPVPPHDPSLRLDYGQCEEHKKAQTQFYCDTCKIQLCDECIVTTHKGHEFTSAQVIRESLQERTASLEEIDKTVCETIISECFQSLEKLKENHVSCVKEVRVSVRCYSKCVG